MERLPWVIPRQTGDFRFQRGTRTTDWRSLFLASWNIDLLADLAALIPTMSSQAKVLVHGQVTIIFVVSVCLFVCLSVCLFVQSFC